MLSVGLFHGANLVIGQMQVQGCDRFRKVVGFGRADDRGGHQPGRIRPVLIKVRRHNWSLGRFTRVVASGRNHSVVGRAIGNRFD